MNSVHDLGGMHGFGAVRRPEEDEPIFQAEWEKAIFAIDLLALAQGLTGSGDASRHAIERMGNVRYLTTSYYEHWLAGISTRLIECGVIGADELSERMEAIRLNPSAHALPPAGEPDELTTLAAELIENGASSSREIVSTPKFVIGNEVITTRRSSRGHTRLPRYARGRRGRIARHHGAHVFPDTNAHGFGESPQHLYSVRFDAEELWGDAADGRGCVNIDLWESYLVLRDTEDE